MLDVKAEVEYVVSSDEKDIQEVEEDMSGDEEVTLTESSGKDFDRDIQSEEEKWKDDEEDEREGQDGSDDEDSDD